MLHFAKLVFYLFRELIFDNKEEYDFKSARFNTRKFLILILITLSFVVNVWVIYRFIGVAVELVTTKSTLEQCEKTRAKPPKHCADAPASTGKTG